MRASAAAASAIVATPCRLSGVPGSAAHLTGDFDHFFLRVKILHFVNHAYVNGGFKTGSYSRGRQPAAPAQRTIPLSRTQKAQSSLRSLAGI
jgi:hypothetical protein